MAFEQQRHWRIFRQICQIIYNFRKDNLTMYGEKGGDYVHLDGMFEVGMVTDMSLTYDGDRYNRCSPYCGCHNYESLRGNPAVQCSAKPHRALVV